MPFNPETTCDVTIDVSHHQGEIDWEKLKAAGIQCVMIKAIEGSSIDSRWDVNRDGAQKQGLLVIAYAFVTSMDPAEQAKFFVQTAELAAGMPAALDWEGSTAPTADVVERMGLAVFNVIKRDPLGYWGISPPHTPTAAMTRWPRWIPRYGVNDGNPDMAHKPTEPWLFWQYTSKLEIDGIQGDVDASLFSGSESELKAWCETGVLPASLGARV
jgi:lysozyme